MKTLPLIVLFFCALVFGVCQASQNETGYIKCDDTTITISPNRLTMPLERVGNKYYYLGIVSKLSWYKAGQFCRYHGMDLASITSQEENNALYRFIAKYGYGKESVWLSGTDLGSEGSFYWMSNGHPLTFKDFSPGQPDNYNPAKTNESENCLLLWNIGGKGYKWNDERCSSSYYFVCELQ